MGTFIIALTITAVLGGTMQRMMMNNEESLTPVDKSFLQLSSTDVDGDSMTLDKYKDSKCFIIFNSASEWGLTKTNYTQLVELWNEYHNQGLMVIDVPSNDFNQEHKTNAQIKQWAATTYNVTFPILAKQHVNGADTCEIYRWLRLNSSLFNKATNMAKKIEWNYGKFLVSRDGSMVKYFSSTTAPDAMLDDIKKCLA